MGQMFPRGFSETLSTKRAVITGTRRGAPVTYLSDVRCAPILPLESTAQQEAFVRGVSVDLQVFCDAADIITEDIIVMSNGDEYTVVEISKWAIKNKEVLQLAVRKYQGT